MSSPPKRSDEPSRHSAVSSPDYDVKERAAKERDSKTIRTDFGQLNEELELDKRPAVSKKTITDYIIDACTPALIFVMIFIVVWFLLDVRFIFTEVSDLPYRIIAFCLVMGIVASNRLLATDGSDESKILVFALMGVSFIAAIAMNIYSGAVAGGFNFGALFNAVVVGFIWWMTNRMVHECCVDENKIAGDVGIMTGTLRNIQRSIRPGSAERKTVEKNTLNKRRKHARRSMRAKGHILETEEIGAIDPLEWKDPETNKETTEVYAAPSKKLSERHPGISIFYFSVPAMVIFALGLPVLMQGGDRFIWRGHIYVAVFTFSALSLLLLTSLGGLRQYFRSRNVYFPKVIGVFWLGLGMTMVIMVMTGAYRLPMPPMPEMLHIEEHETGFFSRDSTFQLQSEQIIIPQGRLQTERAIGAVSDIVLLIFGLFVAFAILRGIGSFAASVGRKRDQYPPWVVSFFNGVDRFLVTFVRLPKIEFRERQRRMRRGIAQSNAFSSNLQGQAEAARDETENYIAHAYDALCALAYDMGVPKQDDQTPYEFIESFPKELEGLKDDARVLTDLYVRVAYSRHSMDSHTLDRLRQFWYTYDKVRTRIIR